MKNSIQLAFLGLMFFALVGCEQSQQNVDVAEQYKAGKVVYSITNVDGQFEADPIVLENVKNSVHSKQLTTRNPNSSATGIYNFPPGEDFFLTFTFNAIQNNGGVHGSSHIVGSESSGFLDVKVGSDCLLVNGDKAYWGGVITRWIVTPEFQDFFDNVIGGPYEGFGVGHQIYWSAMDNGEGGNATGPDEGGDAYIIVPEGFDAEDIGFENWCQFTELDYAGTFHPPITHGYIPGSTPSNVQIQ